jgi:hypothetical protein
MVAIDLQHRDTPCKSLENDDTVQTFSIVCEPVHFNMLLNKTFE